MSNKIGQFVSVFSGSRGSLQIRFKHFSDKSEVFACADAGLMDLDTLPANPSDSDILIYDTLIEKLTKPRKLDFESDFVDVYERAKKGVELISKVIDKKLKTLSAQEITQAYDIPYSSSVGRVQDSINNIRVTAIKLRLLASRYDSSLSTIKATVKLENDENTLSRGRNISDIKKYADELLSASIALSFKAIKDGYDFPDVLSYVGTAKEFQLEADEVLTEKMCALVKNAVDKGNVNHKSVEVCLSYMANLCKGKLPVIELAVYASLKGISIEKKAVGFISVKMKGYTIPSGRDLLKVQWDCFSRGKEIPTDIYSKDARAEHNRQRAENRNNPNRSGLLDGTGLVERANRGEFPIGEPVRPALVPQREIKVITSKPSSKPTSKSVEFEPLEVARVLARLSAITERNPYKRKIEIAKVLRQEKANNFKLAEVIDEVASECGIDLDINKISKEQTRIKQQIRNHLDTGRLDEAYNLAIKTFNSGLNYEDDLNSPITTQRMVVDFQRVSPVCGAFLARRAVEMGSKLNFETIHRTSRALSGKITSSEDWEYFTDLAISSIENGFYDLNGQRDQQSLGIMLATLGGEKVNPEYSENDLYDVCLRQKQGIKLANYLLDAGLVFSVGEDARFNNLIRGNITTALRLKRVSSGKSPSRDDVLIVGKEKFKKEKRDIRSESYFFLRESINLMSKVLSSGNDINPNTVNSMLTRIKEEKLDLSDNDVLEISDIVMEILDREQDSIKNETLSTFVRYLVESFDFGRSGSHFLSMRNSKPYIGEPDVLALFLVSNAIKRGKVFGRDTINQIYDQFSNANREDFSAFGLRVIDENLEYLRKLVVGEIVQAYDKKPPKAITGTKTVYETGSGARRGLLDGTGILEKRNLSE